MPDQRPSWRDTTFKRPIFLAVNPDLATDEEPVNVVGVPLIGLNTTVTAEPDLIAATETELYGDKVILSFERNLSAEELSQWLNTSVPLSVEPTPPPGTSSAPTQAPIHTPMEINDTRQQPSTSATQDRTKSNFVPSEDTLYNASQADPTPPPENSSIPTQAHTHTPVAVNNFR
ncbi:unnamed protein product [Calypogeia fissa]